MHTISQNTPRKTKNNKVEIEEDPVKYTKIQENALSQRIQCIAWLWSIGCTF